MTKFLNRILSLESSEQNAVFDGYAERLQIATEKAMQDGTLDRGLENYRADKVVLNETQDIKADETTGTMRKYYNLTAHNKIKPLPFHEVNIHNSAFMGFYQSKNGDTFHLDNDWRITQKRVSNEQRIETIGLDYLHSDLLTKRGLFTERIGYQTRYFIPAEKDTAKILDEVIKISPVSRVESSHERMAAKVYSAKEKPSILETLKQNAEKSRLTYGDKSEPDKKAEMSI